MRTLAYDNTFKLDIYDEKFSMMPLPLTSSWRKKPATAIIARRPFWSSFVAISCGRKTKAERETRRIYDGHADAIAATA